MMRFDEYLENPFEFADDCDSMWEATQSIKELSADIELGIDSGCIRVVERKHRGYDKTIASVQVASNNNRAAALGLEHDLSTEEWRRLCVAFRSCCAYCGVDTWPVMEHVVPISRGGGTTLNNVLPSCAECNGKKRAMDPCEWLGTIDADKFARRLDDAMRCFYG